MPLNFLKNVAFWCGVSYYYIENYLACLIFLKGAVYETKTWISVCCAALVLPLGSPLLCGGCGMNFTPVIPVEKSALCLSQKA